MRYAIRNEKGLFYSGNFVPEIRYVSRRDDPTRADAKHMLVPQFEAGNVLGAVKYESVPDAVSIQAHPDLVDPAAFVGCEVVECEFDTTAPLATRPT